MSSSINVEQIYDQHFEALYRFFYFKVLNKPLAEDLTSQTFIKFVEVANQKKRDIEDPTNFLYGIGRNVFNDYLREKYKEKQVHLDDFDNIAAVKSETPRRGASIEDRALPHIEQLPNSQRRVAYMRLIEKQSNGEIANTLNRSSSYVKTTLRRALRSLESSAGTFRSKIPFILLLLPVRGGKSFLGLLTDGAATPDPTFAAALKTGVAASAAAGGAAASEAAGLLAKIQNFFKNPTAVAGTGVVTVVAVVAAIAALSQDTPPQPPQPPANPPQPPLVGVPEPTPPEESEAPAADQFVIATVPAPSVAVLAATTTAPAPAPAPSAPAATPPTTSPKSDATWRAEFWTLERFNQNQLPEIPNRAPSYVREDEVMDPHG